jgi:hypothetical protein
MILPENNTPVTVLVPRNIFLARPDSFSLILAALNQNNIRLNRPKPKMSRERVMRALPGDRAAGWQRIQMRPSDGKDLAASPTVLPVKWQRLQEDFSGDATRP